jgi:uncharacterized membrane protein
VTFILLKFLHVTFMFIGTALAIGPAALLLLLARSGDAAAIRHAFRLTEPIFQISTASYGGGIVFGIAAAAAGALDLTAQWLLTAYILVAILGIHGMLFDRWTKRVARTSGATLDVADGLTATTPLYLFVAMVVLVILIVYDMVTKPALF